MPRGHTLSPPGQKRRGANGGRPAVGGNRAGALADLQGAVAAGRSMGSSGGSGLSTGLKLGLVRACLDHRFDQGAQDVMMAVVNDANSGITSQGALALFAQRSPTTIEGAIALAEALEQGGRGEEARRLIGEWWRTRSFEEATQSRVLTRWGAALTQADHEARLNMLLLGPHGPATRAMIQLV